MVIIVHIMDETTYDERNPKAIIQNEPQLFICDCYM